MAAVTGAAWTNWPTRRSSRNGCTANFRRARANWMALTAAIFSRSWPRHSRSRAWRRLAEAAVVRKKSWNRSVSSQRIIFTANRNIYLRLPCRRAPALIPLVAKSYEGRPIKIEGNAMFPGSNGGTDRYAARRLRFSIFTTLTAPNNSRTTAKLFRAKMR